MSRWRRDEPVHITIPEAINEENVTWYEIHVRIRSVEWTVRQRYRSFVELHDCLVEHNGVDKEIMPQKKLLGNKDPSFIMKRRRELEAYLQSVFTFLQHKLPQTLAQFLQLTRYDQHYILRELASSHHNNVKMEVVEGEADLSPVQLHAISQRLRMPCPPEDCEDPIYDFTNVADMACNLQSACVTGSDSKLGSSNIVPNSLTFDFLAFKSLTKLVLADIDCSPNKIEALGMTRKTLEHLEISRCNLKSISDALLCDTHHMDRDEHGNLSAEQHISEKRFHFSKLTRLDLSSNQISTIDATINLAPKLRVLVLKSNQITSIDNLGELTDLDSLDVSENSISSIGGLHIRLGQIAHLDLSMNKVTSLEGCSKLYSLQTLLVASNRVRTLDDAIPISNLPNLEALNLQGNHVTTVVDYRLKVLEAFGKKCSDLCLDNELPTQTEVDKVSVLMALRVAKEGRSATSLFGNLPRRV